MLLVLFIESIIIAPRALKVQQETLFLEFFLAFLIKKLISKLINVVSKKCSLKPFFYIDGWSKIEISMHTRFLKI